MRIKDILLVARAGEPCEAQLAITARMAGEHDAMVDGVCVYPEPDLSPAEAFADTKVDAGVLSLRQEAIERMVAPIEAAYRAVIADHGHSHSWSSGEAEERTWALIRQARFADLVVAGLPGDDSFARRLVESLAINSGAACLLTPCSVKSDEFQRVMLAWDGSREAKRAMDDGLVFMAAARSVRVLIAHEDGDGAFYEDHGGHLLSHLSRHGVHAELKVIAKPGGKIGDVLLAECQAFAADLLIMGAYGHARAREVVLGGATGTMLARAAQPVLMSH
jgi:nucleotide-binding universal stress UspA family protein